MADRRPIVFYERLMENYDEQVAHLMLAKRHRTLEETLEYR